MRGEVGTHSISQVVCKETTVLCMPSCTIQRTAAEGRQGTWLALLQHLDATAHNVVREWAPAVAEEGTFHLWQPSMSSV